MRASHLLNGYLIVMGAEFDTIRSSGLKTA
jgi:hypothetical protein